MVCAILRDDRGGREAGRGRNRPSYGRLGDSASFSLTRLNAAGFAIDVLSSCGCEHARSCSGLAPSLAGGVDSWSTAAVGRSLDRLVFPALVSLSCLLVYRRERLLKRATNEIKGEVKFHAAAVIYCEAPRCLGRTACQSDALFLPRRGQAAGTSTCSSCRSWPGMFRKLPFSARHSRPPWRSTPATRPHASPRTHGTAAPASARRRAF